jgi:hypothetical protein
MGNTGEIKESTTSRFALTAILAAAASFARLIPHPWNFTPVGALGLFGGARLRLWQALTLPLAIMCLTDLATWAKDGWLPFNPYVYGSFLVSVLLGRLLTRTNAPGRIFLCTVAASMQFFLVTNFGVWAAFRVDERMLPAGASYMMVHDDIYPNPTVYYADNPRGLAACYWLAAAFSRPEAPPLGFFGNLLAGDLFFSALLFGAHAWLTRRFFQPTALPAVR